MLDEFGFVDPVRGKKSSTEEIKLNKNFYPDENKEKEQIEILKAGLNK